MIQHTLFKGSTLISLLTQREKQCLATTQQWEIAVRRIGAVQRSALLVIVPVLIVVHSTPKVLGIRCSAEVTYCIEETVDVTTLNVYLQGAVVTYLVRELLGQCSTVGIVCMHHIINPQYAGIAEIWDHIQALVQLRVGNVIILLCCTKTGLMSHPKLGTRGNLTLNHNVNRLTSVRIDTGWVIHIAVCIDAQIACNLALNTVRLIHLHTETLGIVVRPALLTVDGIGLAPVAVPYLQDHRLQCSRESLVVGICLYLVNAH